MLAKRLLYAKRTKDRPRTEKTINFNFSFKRKMIPLAARGITPHGTDAVDAVADHTALCYSHTFLMLRVQA